MSEQSATVRCNCGRDASVKSTSSPWEFEWWCECGGAGCISWAHENQPPQWPLYQGKRMAKATLQGVLPLDVV